mmetsp:Transcript_11220/g.31081  ORF Transcript_11220/g.31081 Transcript_11220/m.31081 type:complete len:383 (-) Transcript_11220:186-1334(-)
MGVQAVIISFHALRMRTAWRPQRGASLVGLARNLWKQPVHHPTIDPLWRLRGRLCEPGPEQKGVDSDMLTRDPQDVHILFGREASVLRLRRRKIPVFVVRSHNPVVQQEDPRLVIRKKTRFDDLGHLHARKREGDQLQVVIRFPRPEMVLTPFARDGMPQVHQVRLGEHGNHTQQTRGLVYVGGEWQAELDLPESGRTAIGRVPPVVQPWMNAKLPKGTLSGCIQGKPELRWVNVHLGTLDPLWSFSVHHVPQGGLIDAHELKHRRKLLGVKQFLGFFLRGTHGAIERLDEQVLSQHRVAALQGQPDPLQWLHMCACRDGDKLLLPWWQKRSRGTVWRSTFVHDILFGQTQRRRCGDLSLRNRYVLIRRPKHRRGDFVLDIS